MSVPAPTVPSGPDPQSQPLAQIEPSRVVIRLPKRAPVATYTILGLTIFVFLLQLATSDPRLSIAGVACGDLPSCYGLKINSLILAGQWWRLITPVLLHAGLLHIGFNMYALYVIGPELERHFDHWPYIALYVLTGFSGVVMSFLLTASPSLGASTAIFGLLGAEGIFVYRNQKIFGPRAQDMLRNIVFIAIINLGIGLSPGIDNWGHVGGLLGGIIFAWVGGPIYGVDTVGVEYYLANRTPKRSVWLASLLVALIFAALAAIKFLA